MLTINGVNIVELLERSRATPAPNEVMFNELWAAWQDFHANGNRLMGVVIAGQDISQTWRDELARLKPPHLDLAAPTPLNVY